MSTPTAVNEVRLDYSISFVEGADLVGAIAFKSHAALVNSYYLGSPEPKGTTLGGYQHDLDAEKQAINTLANRIFTRLGCKDDDEYRAALSQVRKGRLTLFSSMGPCHSCRGVFKQFLGDFPALTLEVTYRNQTRNGKVRLLPAGGGLHGDYGYADAEQIPGQDWRKTFVGVPMPMATAVFLIKFASGPECAATVTAVAGRPYTSFLYRPQGGSPIAAETAALDRVAKSVRDTITGQRDSTLSGVGFRKLLGNVSSGHVWLTGEQGPTADGRTAIAAFVKDFPKVTLRVAYDGATAAGGGLGYADAAKGDADEPAWVKVFKPTA
ncbi:deaminase domain-containing protein [Streptacidiphilus sp. PAMC 29251]